MSRAVAGPRAPRRWRRVGPRSWRGAASPTGAASGAGLVVVHPQWAPPGGASGAGLDSRALGAAAGASSRAGAASCWPGRGSGACGKQRLEASVSHHASISFFAWFLRSPKPRFSRASAVSALYSWITHPFAAVDRALRIAEPARDAQQAPRQSTRWPKQQQMRHRNKTTASVYNESS